MYLGGAFRANICQANLITVRSCVAAAFDDIEGQIVSRGVLLVMGVQLVADLPSHERVEYQARQ